MIDFQARADGAVLNSVSRFQRSIWELPARVRSEVRAEQSGMYQITSSIRMEIEVATAIVMWLSNTPVTKAIDSQFMPRREQNG